MEELDAIAVTIGNLRIHFNDFVDAINSAIERSESTPELSTRKFFFRLGEGLMPSRLFKGHGSFNVIIIDEAGVVMKQTLKAGGEFIVHTHSDATEITLVTKGLMKEKLSGKTLPPGHCFRAEVNQPHQYEILEDSILITTFIFTD